MKPWIERPIEIRNLFNPAFCGLVLERSLRGFEDIDPRGMPYSLSLLVLPLVLQKETRDMIAAHPRTSLLSVIEKQPHLLIGVNSRARDLLPFTHEAFGLLAASGCFKVSGDGRLLLAKKGVKGKTDGTEESVSCQHVARRVGREFARVGDRATVYTTLGIRP